MAFRCFFRLKETFGETLSRRKGLAARDNIQNDDRRSSNTTQPGRYKAGAFSNRRVVLGELIKPPYKGTRRSYRRRT